ALSVYAAIVEREIKKNWRFPNFGGLKLVCVVELRIASDGSIDNFHVVQSSGRPEFDASAMKAVQETEKLPPPPNASLSMLQLNFNSQEKQ
ncbi:MAG: TonB C-terminal domain-containing protein, partial [Desulfovibrionaceae bacterium]|nr:TonB C-terminal domain-containing protein [Desulfovibrionaceae bacterium]